FIVLDLRLTKKIGCLGEIAFFYEKKSKKATEEKPQQQSSSSSSSSSSRRRRRRRKQTKAEKTKRTPSLPRDPEKRRGERIKTRESM
ncbi:hypothetical protein, partial [Bacteroides clarus]|uniref:hypothetical protein n=1 Tax=Bacteroides clarus TaxID=626929 RepID=UPI00356A33A5